MTNEKTGRLMARVRQEQGLTQQELAARLGVTAQAVSKWETGRSFPDPSLAEPLCEALGLTLAELYAGEQREPPRRPDWKKLKPHYRSVCLWFLAGAVLMTIADLCLTYEHEETGVFVVVNGYYWCIWIAHKVFLVALALWACRRRNEVDPFQMPAYGVGRNWHHSETAHFLLFLLAQVIFSAVCMWLSRVLPWIDLSYRWSPGIPWGDPGAILHTFVWNRLICPIDVFANMAACVVYAIRRAWLRRRKTPAAAPVTAP